MLWYNYRNYDDCQGIILEGSFLTEPPADQCRATAQEIRQLAQQTTLPAVRADLLQLAERYERLAARIEKRKDGT